MSAATASPARPADHSPTSSAPQPSSSAPTNATRKPPKIINCRWDECTLTFNDPEDLYHHLCNDHVGRKSTNNLCLTCKWEACEVSCAKRDHITSHLRVHTPLKPHACEACGKTFKRPQDLKKHERIHTEAHQQEQADRQVARAQAAAAQSSAAHAAAVAAAAAAAGLPFYASSSSSTSSSPGATVTPAPYHALPSNGRTSAPNGSYPDTGSLYPSTSSASTRATPPSYSALLGTTRTSSYNTLPGATSTHSSTPLSSGTTDPNSYSYLAHGTTNGLSAAAGANGRLLGKRERESFAAIGDFMSDVRRRKLNPTYDSDMAHRLQLAFGAASGASATAGGVGAMDQGTLTALLSAMAAQYHQQQSQQQAQQVQHPDEVRAAYAMDLSAKQQAAQLHILQQQQQQQQQQKQQQEQQQQQQAAFAALAAGNADNSSATPFLPAGGASLRPSDLAQMNAFLLQLGANAAKSLEQEHLHHQQPALQQTQHGQQHLSPQHHASLSAASSNHGSLTSAGASSNGASPSPSNFSMDSFGGASSSSSSGSSSGGPPSEPLTQLDGDSPFSFSSLHDAGLTSIPGFDEAFLDGSFAAAGASGAAALDWGNADIGPAISAAPNSGMDESMMYPTLLDVGAGKRPIAALPSRAAAALHHSPPLSSASSSSASPAPDASVSASGMYPSLHALHQHSHPFKYATNNNSGTANTSASSSFDALVRSGTRGAPLMPQLAPVDMSQANYIKVDSLTRAAPSSSSAPLASPTSSTAAWTPFAARNKDSAVRDVMRDDDDEEEDKEEDKDDDDDMAVDELPEQKNTMRITSLLSGGAPGPAATAASKGRQHSEAPSEVSTITSSSSGASTGSADTAVASSSGPRKMRRTPPTRSRTLDLMADEVARMDVTTAPPAPEDATKIPVDVRRAHIALIKDLLIALNFPERAARIAADAEKRANTLPPLRIQEDEEMRDGDDEPQREGEVKEQDRVTESNSLYPTLPPLSSITRASSASPSPSLSASSSSFPSSSSAATSPRTPNSGMSRSLSANHASPAGGTTSKMTSTRTLPAISALLAEVDQRTS